eukprot:GHRQ01027053.1.p3 GENE.GHRQ01027053.1~~GHRQ01027053.1.p3  ORF type:complete len:106 (+),score=13.75 GHRQ01027053.1:506-823(+)
MLSQDDSRQCVQPRMSAGMPEDSLGCDIELEAITILNDSIPQLDAQAASLLECLPRKQGLQCGIQHLTHILQQHRLACAGQSIAHAMYNSTSCLPTKSRTIIHQF